jgi:hypothetical protein
MARLTTVISSFVLGARMDLEVEAGKAAIVAFVKSEMRSYPLEQKAFSFHWQEEFEKVLWNLSIHRGPMSRQLRFREREVEEWIKDRSIAGRHRPAILKAVQWFLKNGPSCSLPSRPH